MHAHIGSPTVYQAEILNFYAYFVKFKPLKQSTDLAYLPIAVSELQL
jgi:hypothetical protein